LIPLLVLACVVAFVLFRFLPENVLDTGLVYTAF
jgi:hypothetical protein